MKKLFALVLAMNALLLSSCNQQGTKETTSSTEETMITVTTSATETTIPQITPDQLPKPDEIRLKDDHYAWYEGFVPKYRSIYFGFSGTIGDLGEFVPIHGDKTDEMEMANYVRYNNIRKEDFIAAVQKDYELCLWRGEDIYDEGAELPNPDIIYTFDNEIINAYYRRENPVVPEKYKTYESYEEYLKANP